MYLKIYIYFLTHEDMITQMCISDLGRSDPGGQHVICKSTDVTTRHIRLCGYAFTMTNWFGNARVWYGPMALHSVIAGSISSGGDQNIHYWWDLKRSKQLFSVSVCHTQCLPVFLVMVIQYIIPLITKNEYFGSFSSLIHILLNIIDIFCLHVVFC